MKESWPMARVIPFLVRMQTRIIHHSHHKHQKRRSKLFYYASTSLPTPSLWLGVSTCLYLSLQKNSALISRVLFSIGKVAFGEVSITPTTGSSQKLSKQLLSGCEHMMPRAPPVVVAGCKFLSQSLSSVEKHVASRPGCGFNTAAVEDTYWETSFSTVSAIFWSAGGFQGGGLALAALAADRSAGGWKDS